MRLSGCFLSHDARSRAIPITSHATTAPSLKSRTHLSILSQLRVLDIKRLRYKIGTAPAQTFALIKEKTRRCSPDLPRYPLRGGPKPFVASVYLTAD
jgi:hypothetical protein